MDTTIPTMPRLQEILQLVGIPSTKDELDSMYETLGSENVAVAATMPKTIETVDGIQEDLRRKLMKEFEAPGAVYFKNKYYWFIEDMLLAIHQQQTAELPAFHFYIWTINYEFRYTHDCFRKADDAHGPLPNTFKDYATLMLAALLLFRKCKLSRDMRDCRSKDEKMSGSKTETSHDTSVAYQQLLKFDQTLEAMTAKYVLMMESLNGLAGTSDKEEEDQRSISKLLQDEVRARYPWIRLPDLYIFGEEWKRHVSAVAAKRNGNAQGNSENGQHKSPLNEEVQP